MLTLSPSVYIKLAEDSTDAPIVTPTPTFTSVHAADSSLPQHCYSSLYIHNIIMTDYICNAVEVWLRQSDIYKNRL